jgi:YVTN family beta-propeller protein
MAFGNGLLWVIAGRSVVRIDPQTDQVIGKPIPAPVPEEAELLAIAVDKDGLWVSIVGGGDIDRRSGIDSIVRIDPETGETLAAIPVPRGPMSMALTPGMLWVVNFGLSADTVSRIDTKTNQLLDEPVTTGYAPYSMDVGDGSLWVINHDDGTLTRIDAETSQVIANIQLPAEPHRVAFGEGAVWVGNWHDFSVSRIDPQTDQVVGEPIPIGYHTGNIAAGDGNVWVTSDYRGVQAFPAPFQGHTVLIRIDPETDKVVETISLGSYPVDVEATEGAVWVSIQNPNRVLKIQP